jgi:fucose permease
MSFSGGVFNISINAQAIALQNRVGKVLLGRFHGAWSLGAGASAVLSGWFATFLPLVIHLTLIPALAISAFYFASRNMLNRDEEDKNIAGSTRKALNIFKAPKETWIITLAAFLAIFPELTIMDWSTVFGRKSLGLAAGEAAVPYIAFIFAMIVGRLSLERLTKIWPLHKISRTAVVIGAVAFLASIFVAPLVASSDKTMGMIVLAILWFVVGLGLSSTVPTVLGAAAFVKGFTATQVIAMMSLIHTIAFMLAKMAMGGLAQAITLQWAFIFPITLMFAAAVLVGIVGKKTPSAATLENAYPPTGPIAAID